MYCYQADSGSTVGFVWLNHTELILGQSALWSLFVLPHHPLKSHHCPIHEQKLSAWQFWVKFWSTANANLICWSQQLHKKQRNQTRSNEHYMFFIDLFNIRKSLRSIKVYLIKKNFFLNVYHAHTVHIINVQKQL